MSSNIPSLAIVRSPGLVLQIKDFFSTHDLEAPSFTASAMDGISMMDTVSPELVFVEIPSKDLPINVLVSTLRQLGHKPVIWGIKSSPKQPLPEAWHPGLFGILPTHWMQMTPQQITSSHRHAPQEDQPDTAGEPPGIPKKQLIEIDTLSSSDLTPEIPWVRQGNLTILGDITRFKHLSVSGSLVIKGHCHESHILCHGDLKVEKGIFGMSNGIFCKGSLQTLNIEDALVTCGGSLFFDSFCKNAQLTVGDRLVGRGALSRLVGGKILVGQHISASALGNSKGTPTEVILAPRKSIPPHAQFESVQNDTGTHFTPKTGPSTLYHPENHADICVEKLYKGVTIRIGDQEDIIVKNYSNGIRVFLSEGIIISKREKKTLKRP